MRKAGPGKEKVSKDITPGKACIFSCGTVLSANLCLRSSTKCVRLRLGLYLVCFLEGTGEEGGGISQGS